MTTNQSSRGTALPPTLRVPLYVHDLIARWAPNAKAFMDDGPFNRWPTAGHAARAAQEIQIESDYWTKRPPRHNPDVGSVLNIIAQQIRDHA